MNTRLGKLIRVKNTKAKAFSHENDTYQAVLIKLPTGDVKCLLFTDSEITKAELRTNKNTEDQLEQSFISLILD